MKPSFIKIDLELLSKLDNVEELNKELEQVMIRIQNGKINGLYTKGVASFE